MPMQALDHAAGYFLAFGVNAALCKMIKVRMIQSLKLSTDIIICRKEVHTKCACLSPLLANGFALWVIYQLKKLLERESPCPNERTRKSPSFVSSGMSEWVKIRVITGREEEWPR